MQKMGWAISGFCDDLVYMTSPLSAMAVNEHSMITPLVVAISQ